MNWFQIPKGRVPVSAKRGDYKSWKPELRLEARQQCVYCAIPDKEFGGIRHFHVEHFRPKSKFPDLTNRYHNLFYSCAVCNSFKGDDWPEESGESRDAAGYLDPAMVDYGTVFEVDPTSYEIGSVCAAGRYTAHRLHLNRPHLVLVRRELAVLRAAEELEDMAHESLARVFEMQAAATPEVQRECRQLVDALSALAAARRALGTTVSVDPNSFRER